MTTTTKKKKKKRRKEKKKDQNQNKKQQQKQQQKDRSTRIHEYTLRKKKKYISTQIISYTPNIHPYFQIN